MAASTTARQASRLSVPLGAWDSHIHVIDPEKYPLASGATYKPHPALLPEAIKHAQKIGVPNLVFVQVSTFGTDNSCQLDGLKSVGVSKGRAVIEFNPATVAGEELQSFHEQGVRGVRINLKSVGKELSGDELRELVMQYAKVIAPMKKWALDLHIALAMIPHLEPLLPELHDAGTNIVIDHMGSPPGIKRNMSDHAGWDVMLRLLRKYDNFHVKISAPYRCSRDRGFGSSEVVVRPLLEARQGKGVLWASDWPHTRFYDTDIKPWVDRCLDWCDGDQEVANALFRDNAKLVFDVVD
jgi:predicted TIM-barrel fold metal-dependent hydrolase